jgi:hypothetical protein
LSYGCFEAEKASHKTSEVKEGRGIGNDRFADDKSQMAGATAWLSITVVERFF